MRINSVHCLFEQSGTFKRCFIEKGYKAFDYDILNEFGDDLSYKGEKDKIVNVRGAARSMLSMEYARNFIDSFILDIDSD